MKEEFKRWCIRKAQINNKARSPLFKEREIWWCSVGANIGVESDRKGYQYSRPILIIRKFSRFGLLVIPLTTKQKGGRYYCDLGKYKSVHSFAMLSQVRFISSYRLIRRIRTLSPAHFQTVEKSLCSLIKNDPPLSRRSRVAHAN